MITTLNKIRAHDPCANGWRKLLAHLGKTQADDEPLPILTILDSNGLEDALLCLRAVGGHDREIRLYAVWCARQVQYLLTDPRSLVALDVAEQFADGDATLEELEEAADAAWYVERTVPWDASSATRAAAWAVSSEIGYAARAAREARTAAADTAWGSASDTAWMALEAAMKAQSTRLREICTPVVTKSQQQEGA